VAHGDPELIGIFRVGLIKPVGWNCWGSIHQLGEPQPHPGCGAPRFSSPLCPTAFRFASWGCFSLKVSPPQSSPRSASQWTGSASSFKAFQILWLTPFMCTRPALLTCCLCNLRRKQAPRLSGTCPCGKCCWYWQSTAIVKHCLKMKW